MNKNYWIDIIHTKDKKDSISILEQAGYIPHKGTTSKVYFDNDTNELRLAKVTQYCLARSLKKDKKLEKKLITLYDGHGISKSEMFIFWAFLEGKMFNVIINETKKY